MSGQQPEPREWQIGDLVTVADLAAGVVWDGTVVDVERFGDTYLVVEDSSGLHWRVGRAFASLRS